MVTFYHSDVPGDEKERRQRLWSKGDIKVLLFLDPIFDDFT